LGVFASTFAQRVLFIVFGTDNYYFLERKMGGDQLESGQIFGYKLGNIEGELIVLEPISQVIFWLCLENFFGFVLVELG
jgi:hypothetical protein